MRLGQKRYESSAKEHNASDPNLSSRASLPTFGNFTTRTVPRRFSTRGMEALVTLSKRDSGADKPSPGSSSRSARDTVSMSQAGQKVIPATFKLVPIPNGSAGAAAFNQAGGHNGSFRADGCTLVKKVSEREALFYEEAEHGTWPKSLLPKFYGSVGSDSIKIENLTHTYSRPCVIDLKMGVQTVEDDEASLIKRLKMTTLDYVTRSKFEGCRLEGLSMYRSLENAFVKGTKSQSHSISAHVRVSLQDVLTFFLTDETGVRTDVALRFQTAVEQILEEFEKRNRQYRFIGSSILLIYDNDNRAPYMHWARALRKLHTIAPHVRLSEDQICGLTRRTRCDVRMIDFAHTGPMPAGAVRDEGYIMGLHTILKALKAIRINRCKPIFSMHSAVVDKMEEERARRHGGNKDSDSNKSFTFSTVLGELTALSEMSDDEA